MRRVRHCQGAGVPACEPMSMFRKFVPADRRVGVLRARRSRRLPRPRNPEIHKYPKAAKAAKPKPPAHDPKAARIVTVPRLGEVTIYAPPGEPRGLALFASGDGGWNLGVWDMAQTAANLGYVVAGFSTPAFLKAMETDDEAQCSDAASFFDRIAETVRIADARLADAQAAADRLFVRRDGRLRRTRASARRTIQRRDDARLLSRPHHPQTFLPRRRAYRREADQTAVRRRSSTPCPKPARRGSCCRAKSTRYAIRRIRLHLWTK